MTLDKWNSGVAGTFHHWEKQVLNGNVVLHVQSTSEENKFTGHIQLGTRYYDPDVYTIYTFTKPNSTLEDCQQEIDNVWRKIITNEYEAL